MLPQLSAAVRVFLCTRPTDLRKGFDGLSGLVREGFSQDPLSGHLFLFLNRRRDRIKILYFDRDGLAIWFKRLEVGSFQNLEPTPGTGQLEIELANACVVRLKGAVDPKLLRIAIHAAGRLGGDGRGGD